MSRMQAREKVFQLIFEYTFLKQKNSLTLEDFLTLEGVGAPEEKYIRSTYEGVIQNYYEIQDIIVKNLKNYELNRIYKIDKAILVLATYELCFLKDTPPSIVINEAVELSKRYSTDKSYSFINGVLASIVKKEVKDE